MSRILVVSTPIFKVPLTNYGGLEAIAWLTAKGLAERGHQVGLVAPHGSTCPNVEIVSVPERVSEHDAYQHYWKRLKDYDCCIDHSWGKSSYLLKEEGVFKGPILGVMHAPVNSMYQSLPPVEKPCMVCISKDQASVFEALHNRPARVVYNGCDSELYKPLGIPRTNRFLFLARFSSIKGASIAIDACKKAGVGLDLIGDTSITSEPAYYEECLKKADGKQIRIIGGCSRGNTVWWYSQAHAFLHPIRDFREPFGLAPIEAMLCGLPVVTWDNGAMRETVVKNKTGYFARTFDEFVSGIRMLRDAAPNVMELFREDSREHAKQFSIEAMVVGYEKLALEAISNGGW